MRARGLVESLGDMPGDTALVGDSEDEGVLAAEIYVVQAGTPGGWFSVVSLLVYGDAGRSGVYVYLDSILGGVVVGRLPYFCLSGGTWRHLCQWNSSQNRIL